MKYLLAAVAFSLSAGVYADDHSFDATETKIKAAMTAEIRTDAEKERDRNRRPVETLEFFGLRDDMRIVELVPGGGWYTKLLVPAVSENGEYYAAIGTGRIKDRLVGKPGFEKIKILGEDAKLWREEGARFTSMELADLGVKDVDMVLTFRNYHNFSEQGRAEMNRLAFDALKPGGVYAVVDHTARHMEPVNDSNRRRVDPVLAIKEILDAGFEFVDYSALHRREDDELRYEVGVKSVRGNTDRWTFKFRKPE